MAWKPICGKCISRGQTLPNWCHAIYHGYSVLSSQSPFWSHIYKAAQIAHQDQKMCFIFHPFVLSVSSGIVSYLFISVWSWPDSKTQCAVLFYFLLSWRLVSFQCPFLCSLYLFWTSALVAARRWQWSGCPLTPSHSLSLPSCGDPWTT